MKENTIEMTKLKNILFPKFKHVESLSNNLIQSEESNLKVLFKTNVRNEIQRYKLGIDKAVISIKDMKNNHFAFDIAQSNYSIKTNQIFQEEIIKPLHSQHIQQVRDELQLLQKIIPRQFPIPINSYYVGLLKNKNFSIIVQKIIGNHIKPSYALLVKYSMLIEQSIQKQKKSIIRQNNISIKFKKKILQRSLYKWNQIKNQYLHKNQKKQHKIDLIQMQQMIKNIQNEGLIHNLLEQYGRQKSDQCQIWLYETNILTRYLQVQKKNQQNYSFQLTTRRNQTKRITKQLAQSITKISLQTKSQIVIPNLLSHTDYNQIDGIYNSFHKGNIKAVFYPLLVNNNPIAIVKQYYFHSSIKHHPIKIKKLQQMTSLLQYTLFINKKIRSLFIQKYFQQHEFYTKFVCNTQKIIFDVSREIQLIKKKIRQILFIDIYQIEQIIKTIHKESQKQIDQYLVNCVNLLKNNRYVYSKQRFLFKTHIFLFDFTLQQKQDQKLLPLQLISNFLFDLEKQMIKKKKNQTKLQQSLISQNKQKLQIKINQIAFQIKNGVIKLFNNTISLHQFFEQILSNVYDKKIEVIFAFINNNQFNNFQFLNFIVSQHKIFLYLKNASHNDIFKPQDCLIKQIIQLMKKYIKFNLQNKQNEQIIFFLTFNIKQNKKNVFRHLCLINLHMINQTYHNNINLNNEYNCQNRVVEMLKQELKQTLLTIVKLCCQTKQKPIIKYDLQIKQNKKQIIIDINSNDVKKLQLGKILNIPLNLCQFISTIIIQCEFFRLKMQVQYFIEYQNFKQNIKFKIIQTTKLINWVKNNQILRGIYLLTKRNQLNQIKKKYFLQIKNYTQKQHNLQVNFFSFLKIIKTFYCKQYKKIFNNLKTKKRKQQIFQLSYFNISFIIKTLNKMVFLGFFLIKINFYSKFQSLKKLSKQLLLLNAQKQHLIQRSFENIIQTQKLKYNEHCFLSFFQKIQNIFVLFKKQCFYNLQVYDKNSFVKQKIVSYEFLTKQIPLDTQLYIFIANQYLLLTTNSYNWIASTPQLKSLNNYQICFLFFRCIWYYPNENLISCTQSWKDHLYKITVNIAQNLQNIVCAQKSALKKISTNNLLKKQTKIFFTIWKKHTILHSLQMQYLLNDKVYQFQKDLQTAKQKQIMQTKIVQSFKSQVNKIQGTSKKYQEQINYYNSQIPILNQIEKNVQITKLMKGNLSKKYILKSVFIIWRKYSNIFMIQKQKKSIFSLSFQKITETFQKINNKNTKKAFQNIIESFQQLNIKKSLFQQQIILQNKTKKNEFYKILKQKNDLQIKHNNQKQQYLTFKDKINQQNQCIINNKNQRLLTFQNIQDNDQFQKTSFNQIFQKTNKVQTFTRDKKNKKQKMSLTQQQIDRINKGRYKLTNRTLQFLKRMGKMQTQN